MTAYNVMPTYQTDHIDKDGYNTYTITVNAKDFGGYLDEPTPERCNYLAEYMVEAMLDYEGIDDTVRGYGLEALEEHEDESTVDELLREFDKWYETLYDADVNGIEVTFRDYMMELGDRSIKCHNKWVRRLARRRCDAFTSDREVQALGFALDEMLLATY